MTHGEALPFSHIQKGLKTGQSSAARTLAGTLHSSGTQFADPGINKVVRFLSCFGSCSHVGETPQARLRPEAAADCLKTCDTAGCASRKCIVPILL